MKIARPCCPTCRQVLPPGAVPLHMLHWKARDVSHSALFAAVVKWLADRPHVTQSTAELADLVYAERRRPPYAQQNVTQAIIKHRDKLKPLGWRILSNPGPGGGYRLSRIAERRKAAA